MCVHEKVKKSKIRNSVSLPQIAFNCIDDSNERDPSNYLRLHQDVKGDKDRGNDRRTGPLGVL